MSLSSRQVSYLRGLAHKIKPVVFIGQNGVTESVLKEIDRGLCDHELIKVKISCDDQAQLHEIKELVTTEIDAHLVQVIGHILVFYKERVSDSDKRKIVLP